MKKILFSVFAAALIPFLISCGQSEDSGQRDTLSGEGNYNAADAAVQAADGSLYSVGCLQSNASAIKQKGSSAMSTCLVNQSSGALKPASGMRGKFFTNSYANVYYPATYYNPTYTTYNYSTGTYGSTSNSNVYGSGSNYYGSNYNCTNDSFFKKNNDAFCSWMFGNNAGVNCYYLLGYNQYNYNQYGSSYNSNCSSCFPSNVYLTQGYNNSTGACPSSCFHSYPVYY